jgi:acetolactate synthase-1/3 small subunit
MSTTALSSKTETAGTYKRHTISLYVANKPGVLIRISLVFARRAYNIDSVVVSPASDPRFSMMTITASGDQKTLHQIVKQLNKLVDVVHATDHTGGDDIQRELALVKLQCKGPERTEVLQLAHAMDCATVDIGEESVTFEVVGRSEHLDNVQRILEPYGILEMIRTGKILIARGEQSTA